MPNQAEWSKIVHAEVKANLHILEDEEAPLGKQTLAKIIYGKYPDVFFGEAKKEIERIRGIIKYYTKTSGKRSAKAVAQGQEIEVKRQDSGKTQIRAKLPTSYATKLKEFSIDGPAIAGVLSDIHVPYHDTAALECAFAEFERAGITHLYLNGDIIDAHYVAKFDSKGIKPSMVEEISLTRELMYYLRERFANIPIIYKSGNHDVRIENYVYHKAPEMAKVFEVEYGNAGQLPQLLHLPKLEIQFLSDKTLAHFGKLLVLHGHEFGQSFFSPVNPARGAFLRSSASVLIGHHHQTSMHPENSLYGERLDCFSTGCLCTLSPDYAPLAYKKQNHGAAIVEIGKTGSFKVDNFRIINGVRY